MTKYYTSEDAGSGQHGVCEKCKKGPAKEGHDGCLGTLPGPIMNACCGHGNDRQAYIQYWGEGGKGGKRIAGDKAIVEQLRLIRRIRKCGSTLYELWAMLLATTNPVTRSSYRQIIIGRLVRGET